MPIPPQSSSQSLPISRLTFPTCKVGLIMPAPCLPWGCGKVEDLEAPAPSLHIATWVGRMGHCF